MTRKGAHDKQGKCGGRVSHQVIIDLSHHDAFDSWRMIRVALLVAPLVRGVAGERPETYLVYFFYSLLMGFAAVLFSPVWIVQGLGTVNIFPILKGASDSPSHH